MLLTIVGKYTVQDVPIKSTNFLFGHPVCRTPSTPVFGFNSNQYYVGIDLQRI